MASASWVRFREGAGSRYNRSQAAPAPRAKKAKIALAAAVTVICGGGAWADNVTWIDPNDGLWREVYRWSTNPNLPAVGDDVTIDVPNADILVTINQDVQTIHSLISNERLTIESGGLSVASDSTVNGAFTLSGGSLSGSGNFTLNGPSTWINQSTMDGSGKTIVAAAGSLNILPGTFNKTLARSLDNFGAITLTGNSIFSSITMQGSTIDNKVGASFTVDNIADSFFYGLSDSNAFLNHGTFIKTGTASATFGGTGSNPVPFVNQGQVNLQEGTIILQTGATHSGHFSLASGTLLQFEGGHTFTATSDISGAGNVIFNSAGSNFSDGTFNLSGTVTFAGAVNSFNGAFTASNLQAPNGTTLIFNGPTTIGSATVTDLFLGGVGDVTISGNSQWNGFGTMSGSGKTIIASGATFTLSPAGAPKNIQRIFVNSGTVNWNGTGTLAVLNLGSATFENKPGATFNVNGDQYAFYGNGGVNTFLNEGLFAKSGTGSASFTGAGASVVSFNNSGTMNISGGFIQLDAQLINSGSVSLSSATIALTAGLNNTGAIAVGAGGILNIGGALTTAQLGSWSNSGGKVNLLGTLNNTSSTLTLNDTTGDLCLLTGSQIVNGALVTAGSSRLKVAGAATIDGLTLSSDVKIFQATNLTVLHGLTLTGGTLTLDAGGPSLINFQGTQTIGGTGTITTAGGTGTATLAASSASTLTIASGITIHPGARDITVGASDATLISQGLMLVDSARTLTLCGTSIQNLGTFQIDNGGTIFANGTLANLSAGTLSGGAWRITSNGTLRLASGSINVNAATLVLDGPGANISTGPGGTNDALLNLTQNAASGDLSILNGKTLSTAGDFVNNGILTVGAGSGLTTGGLFTHNGTMTTAGVITTSKTMVDGFLTLAGGTHTVSADFVLGSAKNNARYDLTSGTLTVGGFGTIGAGPSGAGVFNLGGGSFTVARQLYVASAGTNTSTLNVTGGALNAGEMIVGFFGGAQGIVNQSGGSVILTSTPALNANGMLTLGLSSLPTTAGTYNLSAGTLTDQGVQIGFAGTGTFTQTGGVHTVNGDLSIAMFSGGSATYSLSSGANLNVLLDEVVGVYGNGTLNQSGGVNTIGNVLKLGTNSGSFGTVNLSGGTLTAKIVDVINGKFNAAGGTLSTLNFLQEGGEVAGTLSGQQTFTYVTGAFTGRLINTGSVVLYIDFAAGNGLDNRSLFDIPANRAVTLNGAGFSGNGTTTLSGTLNASIERIGESGNGSFTQSAGANNVTGDLVVGHAAGLTGAYTLSGGALSVGGDSYVGLDGSGTFTHNAGTHTTHNLFIAANPGSSGSYTLAAGSLTATATKNNGAYTQTGGTASLGNVSGTGSMSVTGGALSAGTIQQNSLAIDNDAVITLATSAGASVVKLLSTPTSPGATGALDLGNNTLVVDYDGQSVIAPIRAAVASGYGATGPHWTGAGIRSNAAAADSSLGIAVAEASGLLHLSGDQTGTFAGQTVDATTVLVRISKLGDANLDGRVTFGDFQRFELGFGQPNATWQSGDFNYDGIVDQADFALLYGNYGAALNGAPLPVSSAELEAMSVFAASVPEPSALLTTVAAGAGLLLKRRRRIHR